MSVVDLSSEKYISSFRDPPLHILLDMAEFIRTSKTRVQGENSLSTKGSNNIRSTIENWLRHFANPELSLTEYRDETKYEEELLHLHRQGMGLFTFEISIKCIQEHRMMFNCSGGRPYITYTLGEDGWVAVGSTLMYCGWWVVSALMYILISYF